LGSLSYAGGTIHAGFAPPPAGASCPPSTNASSYGQSAVDRGHSKGSSTRIRAMEEEMGSTGSGGREKGAGELETVRRAAGKKMKHVRDRCFWQR
jgi:hypothetical protein